jgi:hypothetical protein
MAPAKDMNLSMTDTANKYRFVIYWEKWMVKQQSAFMHNIKYTINKCLVCTVTLQIEEYRVIIFQHCRCTSWLMCQQQQQQQQQWWATVKTTVRIQWQQNLDG